MASLQHIGDAFYLQFIFGGKRHSLPIGKTTHADAERRKANAEDLLKLLKVGRITIPPGVSVPDFILFDGRPPVDPAFATHKQTTLDELREAYVATFSNGAIEANTLYTAKIHLARIEETLGKRFVMSGLTHARLQEHITRRQRTVSPITIKKEIDSFRACFNWGLRAKLVTGTFPSHGLVYPKTTDKLPFLSWKEIEQRIKKGGDPNELWECLYLDGKQVAELLLYAKDKKAPAWVYPMLAAAAYTGMRRSELIRCRVEDIDLAGKVITVREKKRAKGKVTNRRVPISSQLAAILEPYLDERRDALFAFGYGQQMLSVQATQKAFVRLLKKSKWEVLKGWHALRHSWISIMASKGVDQRIIDDCVGHSTEEQRRRYRHLFPEVKKQAIEMAFG